MERKAADDNYHEVTRVTPPPPPQKLQGAKRTFELLPLQDKRVGRRRRYGAHIIQHYVTYILYTIISCRINSKVYDCRVTESPRDVIARSH